MPDKLWKATERAIAKRLGGQRMPVAGRAGNPDVAHPWLAVECKSRESIPLWLTEAMAQARAVATPSQLPVAILHQVGRPHGADLVVLTFGSWCEWFGPVPRDEGEMPERWGKVG